MATAKTCKERVAIAKKHSVRATDASIALEKCLVKGGSCEKEKSSYDWWLENFMIFVGHVNSTCSGGTEALNLVIDQSLEAVKAKAKINPSKEDAETLKTLQAMKRNAAKKKR